MKMKRGWKKVFCKRIKNEIKKSYSSIERKKGLFNKIIYLIYYGFIYGFVLK
jgi:hypothetical protein